MYKEVLRSIDGVSLFPVIAILLFSVFFVFLLLYVWKMDKQQIHTLSQIPLQEETAPSTFSYPLADIKDKS